jgi:predicted nucleic acid-binding protein
MTHLLWDASALAKRYAPERGSETVDALMEAPTGVAHVTTFPGYAEVFALLLRKRNGSAIPPAAFRHAASALRDEVLASPAFRLLTVDNAAILAGIDLIERHNLNSSDAAILSVFLRFSHAGGPDRENRVLIASDHRLLRAARHEGLAVIDPERADLDDIALASIVL